MRSFRKLSGCSSTSRIVLLSALAFLIPFTAGAQENEDCLMCHEDPDLAGTRNGLEISVHIDAETLSSSIHGDVDCIMCHMDLEGTDFHDEEVETVDCGMCHDSEAADHKKSLHGRMAARGGPRAPTCSACHGKHDIQAPKQKTPSCSPCHETQVKTETRSLHGRAAARGDKLAPTCTTCHGDHGIQAAADPRSPTAVMNVPLLCGRCHQEDSAVTLDRDISQDRILENYSMSIHGKGLFEQGLTVTAVCTSCHTSHNILPHTDPASSIHHDNVATTCSQCHGQIEQVHRKVIEGRLWEEEPHVIPACVDCHSPHKIRRVFYPTGVANQDCLRCHADAELTMERDDETVALFVDEDAYNASSHGETACAQCHTDVSPSRTRACETVASKVDCSICHP
ncbi:MAG: hypothetical protein WBG49_20475, partial [Thermoanaerobaculia bacterium]